MLPQVCERFCPSASVILSPRPFITLAQCRVANRTCIWLTSLPLRASLAYRTQPWLTSPYSLSLYLILLLTTPPIWAIMQWASSRLGNDGILVYWPILMFDVRACAWNLFLPVLSTGDQEKKQVALKCGWMLSGVSWPPFCSGWVGLPLQVFPLEIYISNIQYLIYLTVRYSAHSVKKKKRKEILWYLKPFQRADTKYESESYFPFKRHCRAGARAFLKCYGSTRRKSFIMLGFKMQNKDSIPDHVPLFLYVDDFAEAMHWQWSMNMITRLWSYYLKEN